MIADPCVSDGRSFSGGKLLPEDFCFWEESRNPVHYDRPKSWWEFGEISLHGKPQSILLTSEHNVAAGSRIVLGEYFAEDFLEKTEIIFASPWTSVDDVNWTQSAPNLVRRKVMSQNFRVTKFTLCISQLIQLEVNTAGPSFFCIKPPATRSRVWELRTHFIALKP